MDINLTAYERYHPETDTVTNTPESPRPTKNKPRSRTPEPNKRKKTRSTGKKRKGKRKKSKTKGKGKSNTLVNKFYMDTIDNTPKISSLHKTGIQLMEDYSYAPGVKPRVESKDKITRRVIIKNPKTKSKGKTTQKKRKH
tara:strand:+ start:51 stop:470 length:420 start_codon:yes stop_codon:yes gene_type:complete